MAADSLLALVRLRRLARDEAIRVLAASLEVETQAAVAVGRIKQSMDDEEEAASRTDADDLAVEAFGRWLKRARLELQQAEQYRTRAEAETARARAILVAARGALEAAEAERQRRAEEAEQAAQRRAQAALDEIAQQRHGSAPDQDL